MKRCTILVLSALLALSLSACGKEQKKDTTNTSTTDQSAPAQSGQTAAPSDSSTAAPSSTDTTTDTTKTTQ